MMTIMMVIVLPAIVETGKLDIMEITTITIIGAGVPAVVAVRVQALYSSASHSGAEFHALSLC